MSLFAQSMRRGLLILIASAVFASPCFLLEKSPLAAPLAIGMNVSEPLIALNELVQGTPGDSFRYRRDVSLDVGLEHVTRDGSLLVALAASTVLAQKVWRGHRKRARRMQAQRTEQRG